MSAYTISNWYGRWSAKFGSVPQPKPDLIVVHRTGNARPGVTATSNANYFLNTGLASSHEIIDDDGKGGITRVIEFVPSETLAFHVKEHRKALEMGREVYVPGRNRPRGDYATYGIEVDEDPDGWSPETKSLLVARLRDLVLESRCSGHGRFAKMINPMADIVGHSELDPWTRPEDPNGLWHPDEIRQAVDRITSHPAVDSFLEVSDQQRIADLERRMVQVESMAHTEHRIELA